ncbi:aromatic ring-hydroxylating dioxygenase subunit alpha [Gluconobacter cerinus]|uniref:aromatic ring-hydroxylating dioxygenase subunit alpha n=1 Tax=Gluconobacter cerinus TaxID=38307 RepID=UPI003AB18326
MTSPDPETLSHWYPVAMVGDLTSVTFQTMLLDRLIEISRDENNAFQALCGNRPLPVQERYGYLWTSLGEPVRDIPAIPEAAEADRRLVCCGSIAVHSSGLRVVENFLDMAHFPFVHTNILGAEPETEVRRYQIETREEGAEIWATDCTFFQPQAALSASGGILTDYTYRVAAPFSTLLYKTCPASPERQDVIALFVQPMTATRSRAHPVMFLIDDSSSLGGLVEFQQFIFLQDRIILENQRPRLMPLDGKYEIPTMADRSSVAYRRWLKGKGVTYGALS